MEERLVRCREEGTERKQEGGRESEGGKDEENGERGHTPNACMHTQ